ncbi:Macrolide export protein MacA [Planctomycetes bacterium CA13]|uniref:Macrolide export protein MacA n=1 Tax=Novipirellula herctigrandis TaxID=2527986 RepID=A0A5C5ZB63_9BACT|nr:Macrolide export protein MacA [Planctomycetes bacterium CA13]
MPETKVQDTATVPAKTDQSSSETQLRGSSGSDRLASLQIEWAPSNKKRGRRIWPWLVLLLLGGLGFVAYRFGEHVGLPSSDEIASATWLPEIMQNRVDVQLKSVVVQKGRSADAVVVATGYLRSHRQAGIGARSSGRINVITFEEGDKVQKGDLLAELDHKDLDASLAAAAAAVAKAEAAMGEQNILIEQADADRERAVRLRRTNSISESEYDQARFSHAAAVARLRSLSADVELMKAQKQQSEQLLENMFIRAPFDGTVISKDAEEGESILPGGTGGSSGRGSVATIADLDRLEIECDVQEGYISRVEPTQEVDIAVDAVPDKKYHGKVSKIIPMGDRARATIKVRVEIVDADDLLFPEMSGTVFFLPTEKELQINDEPRMFCDEKSIDTDSDEKTFVWVVDDERRAQKIQVDVGEVRDGRIEILDGLMGRERLIMDPDNLKPDTPVRIIE